MNTGTDAAVEALAVGEQNQVRNGPWLAARILASGILACGSSLSCVDVEGGAVELAWTLRTFDGSTRVSCAEARIAEVRVCWQPLDESVTAPACVAGQYRAFPCEAERGVSRFEIPPGSTQFWVEPVCEDGAPAAERTFQVPRPIGRQVQDGKVAALDALLIVASATTRADRQCPPAGCTCDR